ncbi:ABC transporter substrate-binding protein [Bordetella genomosp. 9]|uniref:Bug family tripartite tricarboxylate transporter substrate binding protein n=1 Tax=Bordetella genomosp. 9 TaxID=1416803 RepID=UPI000A292DBD|nr:tripartite tricarboxylate transporter substrate binding protein [Bordetella genomosp. 9]ARP91273.1 ABC transporter substrate-binding protein [Bordetella genomosp. 9]
MIMRRRATLRTLVSAVIAMTALASPNSHAKDSWPNQPIRLIVPSAAGGSPDILCRYLGAELSARLGQPVVVENRPGAGGNIGMQAVARAEPNGYTIGYGNIATLAINRSLFSSLPYDPDRELAPIVAAVTTANLLVVNKDLPVKSVSELVAYAKSRPGSITMGSAGNGTTSHLGGELFKVTEQLNVVHVPYRGSPQAIQDLIGGNVQFMFDNLPSILPSVNAGLVRALAVTAPARSPLAPDVPTMQEAGVKDYELQAWGGFVAPAGTPQPIVDRLNREFNAMLSDENVRRKLSELAFEPIGGTPQAFRDLMNRETGKWGKLVRQANARVD